MNEKKEALGKLVTELYLSCEVDVQPTFPRVLVRLLPKEQVSKGGIILTDKDQNKPTYEGVVLKTYKPFWYREVNDGVERKVYVESLLKPEDHVLFPHMAIGIIPVWPLDGGKGDYRLVPEDQVLAKVEYETEKTEDWLIEALDLSEEVARDVALDLLKKADVIRKDLISKTISGA